jgi:hypothetical protein
MWVVVKVVKVVAVAVVREELEANVQRPDDRDDEQRTTTVLVSRALRDGKSWQRFKNGVQSQWRQRRNWDAGRGDSTTPKPCLIFCIFTDAKRLRSPRAASAGVIPDTAC